MPRLLKNFSRRRRKADGTWRTRWRSFAWIRWPNRPPARCWPETAISPSTGRPAARRNGEVVRRMSGRQLSVTGELDSYLRLQRMNPGNNFAQMSRSRKFGSVRARFRPGQGQGEGATGTSGYAVMDGGRMNVMGNESSANRSGPASRQSSRFGKGAGGLAGGAGSTNVDKSDVMKGLNPVNRQSGAVSSESTIEEYNDVVENYFKAITTKKPSRHQNEKIIPEFLRRSVSPVALGRERFPDCGGTARPGAWFCPHLGHQSVAGGSTSRLAGYRRPAGPDAAAMRQFDLQRQQKLRVFRRPLSDGRGPADQFAREQKVLPGAARRGSVVRLPVLRDVRQREFFPQRKGAPAASEIPDPGRFSAGQPRLLGRKVGQSFRQEIKVCFPNIRSRKFP
jgi:hypothetical protein